jgi:hypothetical protein
VKTPVASDLLTGELALLGQLVERGLGDLQVRRQLVDCHHAVVALRHLVASFRFGTKAGPAAAKTVAHI